MPWSRELRLTLFVIGELQRNGLIHVLYILKWIARYCCNSLIFCYLILNSISQIRSHSLCCGLTGSLQRGNAEVSHASRQGARVIRVSQVRYVFFI